MKSIKILVCSLMMGVGLTSCLKDTPFLDVSNTAPIVEFSKGSLPTKISSWGALPDTSIVDTAIAVDIASPQPLNYPVTVTIAEDTSLITKWNLANPTNTLNVMPDSTFKLSATTVTIPAGYRYAKIPITLYKSKIDPTVSYGMPFVIVSTSQSGPAPIISSNAGSLFYSFIGNPLAGLYNWDFTRYSAPSNAGSPDGTSFTGETTLFTALDPTDVETQSGYYIHPRYEISFTNNNGVLSNFQVALNADDVATMKAAGIVITAGPVFDLADPINKKFIIHYVTATRYVIDTFYK